MGATQRGFPPKLVPDDCGLTPDVTEYAEVSVAFTDRSPVTKGTRDSNLRLDLSVAGGNGAGVIVTSSEPTADCDHTSVLPSTNTLQTQNLLYQHQTMTVYVVARTTAATPDPFTASPSSFATLATTPTPSTPGTGLGTSSTPPAAHAPPTRPSSAFRSREHLHHRRSLTPPFESPRTAHFRAARSPHRDLASGKQSDPVALLCARVDHESPRLGRQHSSHWSN